MEANRFLERLSACAGTVRRALMITASPSDRDLTESHSDDIRCTLELSGFEFEDYTILDNRNRRRAKELVRSADLIILGGGHCPTQNTFFREIGLRKLMADFDGTVFGISAGSMNAADVIPHYQETWDKILDGQRLFEDITYPVSAGTRFFVLCDGSYLYSDGITERICGEAWMIKNGKLKKICEDEEEYVLRPGRHRRRRHHTAKKVSGEEAES